MDSQKTTVEGICQCARGDPKYHHSLPPLGHNSGMGPRNFNVLDEKLQRDFQDAVMFSTLLPAEGHFFGKERRIRVDCWR
jgi:hypothetical protein